MTMPPDKDDLSPSARKDDAFKGAFANLPADPHHRLDALAALNGKFRHALADQLRPVVRALLQGTSPPSEPGQQELARRVNYVLRDAGLAIVDPDSGQPATVVADSSRLRLQSRLATAGRQTRSRNIKALPPLELVEYLRQEPIRTWREQVDRDSSPENPGR
jgi:hypothetical protein